MKARTSMQRFVLMTIWGMMLLFGVIQRAFADEITAAEVGQHSVEAPPAIMFHARADQRDVLPSLIDDLQANGYQFTTYSQYYDALQRGEMLEKPIILTFDDLTFVRGSMNFGYYEQIVRILAEQGVPAVFAVVTQPVVLGANNRTVQLTEQNWEYIERARHWVELGVEFATHTESHPNLDNPSLTQDDLNREIAGSARWIEQQFGVRVTALVTPFGSGITQSGEIDSRVLSALEGTSIRFVVGISVQRQPLVSGQAVYGVGRIMPNDQLPQAMLSMLVAETRRWTEANERQLNA